MALKHLTAATLADDGIEIGEKGRNEAGETIFLNRRLFIQLQVFSGAREAGRLIDAVEKAGLQGVIYADINDPKGVGLLSFSEEPDHFVTNVRNLLNQEPFHSLTPRPQLTMLGRTYTIGYESDLERVLITRPIERVTNHDWPWAIWYPLQRSGRFEQLSAEEQRVVLMEHGGVGRAFGQADLVHDVRLACQGLGTEDNDFIIGLLGKSLYPLSQMVQRMRKTRQTSLYIERLGPFFIGKAIWQRVGGALA